MATQPKFDALLDALVTTEDDLTPEDKAALRAEAGEVAPPPPPAAPEEEAPAEPEAPAVEEAAPAEPEAPAAVEAVATEPVVEQPKKKLSPAQERISELVHERNELQRQLREQNEKWARIDERAQLVKEQQEREQQARAAERARYEAEAAAASRLAERPDPNMDPVGSRMWDVQEEARMARAKAEALERQMHDAINQQRVQNDVNSFTSALQADIQNYRNRQADYDAAAKYATDTRKNFWLSLGHTEEVASQRVQQEALAVAAEAFQNGRSPSDVYYNLAKQWGYNPNQQTKTGGMVGAKEKLAQVAKGQKVVGLGGQPNIADQDAFDIDNMTPAQFAELSEDRFLGMVANPQEYKRLQKWLEKHELGIDI